MARIIALQACRHGLGCSHLVANLAVLLMRQGYRVGLLDTDAKVGGIRTLFRLDKTRPSDRATYWWLSEGAQAHPVLTADLCHYHQPYESQTAGIFLSPLGSYFAIDSPQFQVWQERYGQDKPFEVLQALGDELALDFWLIDNQPEMTDSDLLGLSLADIAIVLLQLDSFDLQRTAVLSEVIQHLQVPQTWLVPSLVLPTIEPTVVRHLLESTYHFPLAGILYLCEEMLGLASSGLFCLHYPDHLLTQTMRAIARQIEQAGRIPSPTS